MIWPFENDTSTTVKRLSNRNVTVNRKRNIFIDWDVIGDWFE